MSKPKTLSSVSNTVRRTFSEEFKQDAVSLVTQQGYSLTQAARSLDLHPNLIRNWKNKFMGTQKDSPQLCEDEKAELKRLQKIKGVRNRFFGEFRSRWLWARKKKRPAKL
ncbi:MAG: transposase [Planctomycetaceae bacterium]|nr:transposase [Planctomycetaceae bacterium]